MDELLLHHKLQHRILCRKEVSQVNKPSELPRWWVGHVREGKDQHTPKWRLEAQIAVGVNWGGS